MSALRGEKFLPPPAPTNWRSGGGVSFHLPFNNIAAVKLDRQLYPDYAWEIFNLLTLPWSYNLSLPDQKKIARFFSQYYPASLVDLFNRAANHNRQYLSWQYNSNGFDESPTEAKLKALVHACCAYKRKIFSRSS
jgi:hypothetical protein